MRCKLTSHFPKHPYSFYAGPGWYGRFKEGCWMFTHDEKPDGLHRRAKRLNRNIDRIVFFSTEEEFEENAHG